jgi:putative hemolysin
MREILGILLLIIANGVFAMAAIAVVSARKARLAQQANQGNAKARLALAFAHAPREFLATVQVGITRIGLLTGALGGATLAQPQAAFLRRVPWLGPSSDALGLALVVCRIASCSLIVGELVPKQLALHNPERIAAAVAAPMRLIARLAAPAVWLLSASTTAILPVLGGHPVSEPPVTEAEMKVLLEQGVQAGVFAAAEHEMVHAICR